MHVNNEVGAVLDLDLVARICQQNNALFHSDTVQSVAKTELDLHQTSPGYRLILNNVLFPAAKKKKQKT